MRHPERRRGVALAAGIATGWLALYVAWLAFEPGGPRALTIFSDTAYLVPIGSATVLALVAASRAPRELRAFWTLMAASNVLWLGGEVAWSLRELAFGPVPFPWWTDAAYLASYALIPLALYSAYRPRLKTVGAPRILDAALVVGVLGLLWWWIVLRPLGLSPGLAATVGLAYPTYGLVLLGMLTATRLLPSRYGTLPTKLVGAGVAASALADGLYTHAVVTHSYLSGDWIALGWQAEAVLFSLAAYAAIVGAGRPDGWERIRVGRERSAGGIAVAAVAATVVVLADAATEHDASTALVAAAGTVAALALVRLALAFAPRRPAPLTRPETGTYDAGYFEDQLCRLVARARHFGDPFAVALVEVDPADAGGDPGLEDAVARRLTRAAREVDSVSCLAPARFAALLPNVELGEALSIAERFRLAVASESLHVASSSRAATISVGVAGWGQGDVPEDLLRRAGPALAAARRLGGNQVRGSADHLVLFADEPLDAERFELIVTLARLVDDREGPDPTHSRCVAALASEIATELGLDEQSVGRTYVAGLLHDLGKVALPDALLRKPGPLDGDEWEEMMRHARRGAKLVARIAAVREAAPAVGAHHERWDGEGYPRGLGGTEIPVEARIVAVADALVAMTTDRPYRSARSETSALTSIWRQSGRRYDPDIVSALLRLDRDGRLRSLRLGAASAGDRQPLRIVQTG